MTVISLSIAFMLVIAADVGCGRVRELLKNYLSAQGFDMICLIPEEKYAYVPAGAVRCIQGQFGDIEIICAPETFLSVLNPSYYLNSRDELIQVIVSYKIYEENGMKNTININGTILKITGVLEKDFSNLYFDSERLIILEEPYYPLVSNPVERYYMTENMFSEEIDGFEVVSQKKLKEAFNRSVKGIEMILNLLSVISLFSAVISHISHSLTLIESDCRQIAVKMTFGAGRKEIFLELLVQDMMIIMMSFLVAMTVLNAVSAALMKKPEPIIPGPGKVILIMVTAVISSLFPAIRSGRISIAEALCRGD